MKKLGLGLISLVTASMLVACGGGGGEQQETVASANVTAPVNADSIAAIEGQSFNFAGGVTSFQTASATTVKIDSADSFTVTATEGTASGDLSFGSCIFKVTASTFAAGSALEMGATVTVKPCNITVATAGVKASENAVKRAVSFVLGDDASAKKDLEVDIAADGTVIVEGVEIGTVTLTPVTGASGS